MTTRRVLHLIGLLALACISAWGLDISPASLPVGGGVFVVGQMTTTQQLTPVGTLPSESLQWFISSGAVPPGLTFDTVKAAIPPGIPNTAGAFTFTVTLVDGSTDQQASRQYTIYVASCLPLALTAASHTPGAAGNPYVGDTFHASCGVPGYTYTLASGTDSDGLTFVPGSSLLSGIPLIGGVFPIGVVVTDPFGEQATASFNLSVLGVGTDSLPDGSIGVPYSQSIAAIGATAPVTWSLGGGATLPPGLSFSPQGQITGIPTTSGTYPFQVVVNDTVSHLSSAQSLSINIPASLTISTASLPN